MAQERQPAGGFLEGSTVRSEDTTRHGLPVSGDAQWSVSAPWRKKHGTEDSRGPGTEPEGPMEAWLLFA
jgi:hypothetical protein